MGRDKKNERGGQYVPLPYGMLKSEAWRSLSGSALKVFFELHTRFNGGNNGRLFLSYSEAAEALGMGKATVKRAFEDLEAKGFLVLEKRGNWYHRQAHEWRLTTKPVQTMKGKKSATDDWRQWSPGKTKRGSETEPSNVTVVPFENPSSKSGSETKPVRPISSGAVGSKSER